MQAGAGGALRLMAFWAVGGCGARNHRELNSPGAADSRPLGNLLCYGKEYSGTHKAFEGHLVGAKADEDVRARAVLRRGATIFTYSDLLSRVERRYKEYLNTLNVMHKAVKF